MLCVCQFSDKEAACFENVENTVAPERIWKWGGTGPAWKWGHRSGAKRRIFFWVVPLHFYGSKSTISRFGERFRDGRYSLASFLFRVLPPVSSKSGGTFPFAPYGVGAAENTYFQTMPRRNGDVVGL